MDEDVQTDYDQLLALLRSGAHAWNAWRSEYPSGLLDLHDAELRGLDLRGANLRGVSMQRAHLTECLLNGADLRGSDLHDTRLNGADLTEATLSQAVLLSLNYIDGMIAESHPKGKHGRFGCQQSACYPALISGLGNPIRRLRRCSADVAACRSVS